MRFLAITLIVHAPHPVTGVRKSTRDRFREVLDNALLAEELGFDGFGVGERHERPFISSSPPVVLSHIAALTSRIRRTVLHLHADAAGLTDSRHRAALELFQSDIAPVLRREIPDPPFPWGPVRAEPAPGGTVPDRTVPGGGRPAPAAG